MYTVYTRGVNQAEIFGPVLKLFSARAGPQLIYYKICTMVKKFILGGGQKLFKILLSTGIICNLISLNLQSQTCWILKTKYYF